MIKAFINRVKANAYLYFLIKALILFSIIYLLDFAIGSSLEHFYFSQSYGRQFRATYAIDRANEDVIIFGSSRAYHHYVPTIFEDRLKLTCYNTGSPGQGILYNYAVLKCILKRKAPKIIILDILDGDFKDDNESSYGKLAFLLPYYKSHPEIDSLLELRGPFEKIKLLSKIYPFNSSVLMIVGGNLTSLKNKRVMDTKGFLPVFNVWNEPLTFHEPEKYKLDHIKLQIFNNFVNDCKKNNIKLYMVCSPTFEITNNLDYTVSTCQKIAKENNVDFYDFTNDTLFLNHPSYFDDPGHLNDKGAKIFTNIFIDKISTTRSY